MSFAEFHSFKCSDPLVYLIPRAWHLNVDIYRRNSPSAPGSSPGDEGRTFLYVHHTWRDFSTRATVVTGTVATWVNDRNPKQLPAVARNAIPSNPTFLTWWDGCCRAVVERPTLRDPPGVRV